MKPFIILALPRSMTAWLANWFTYGNSICYHEGNRHYGTIENLIKMNSAYPKLIGDSNSSLAMVSGDEIKRLQDKIRIGFVFRPYKECLEGFKAVNPDPSRIDSERVMEFAMDSLIDVLKDVDYCEIKHTDILDESKFREFHEYLIPYANSFSLPRHRLLKDLKITQNIDLIWERDYKRKINQ
jgi:hypothetical protein